MKIIRINDIRIKHAFVQPKNCLPRLLFFFMDDYGNAIIVTYKKVLTSSQFMDNYGNYGLAIELEN